MRSLLVPVNFKPGAANAARYAADMALAAEAEIHLLYVIVIPPGTTSTPLPYIMDEMRTNAQWLLRELADDLSRRTHGQINIVTHMEWGGVEARIEEYCDRIRPFLVIMGAPEPPHEQFFNGSDAITALRHLPWPLLVVPEKQRFHAIRTITLACQARDIKNGIPVPFAFIRELKEVFAAHFEVVHFITGCAGEEKDIRALYHWKQTRDELIPELHFVQAESLDDGIAKYLAAHHTDWLMIFPRKHRLLEFHKSGAKAIVTHCAVPVLSILEHVHTAAPEEEHML